MTTHDDDIDLYLREMHLISVKDLERILDDLPSRQWTLLALDTRNLGVYDDDKRQVGYIDTTNGGKMEWFTREETAR